MGPVPQLRPLKYVRTSHGATRLGTRANVETRARVEHVVTTIGADSGQVNQVGVGLIGTDKSIAVCH